MALRQSSNGLNSLISKVNSNLIHKNPNKLINQISLCNIKFGNIHSRTFTHYPIDNELYGLTPDQIQLRETAFNFFQKEIAPIADKIDKDDDFPGMRDFWKKLGDIGFLGITADPEYGGSGLGIFEQCLVLEEFSRVSASISLSCGAHSNLCVNQINRYRYSVTKSIFALKQKKEKYFLFL